MSEPTHEQYGHKPSTFVVTKGYRLFAEMCDACRQDGRSENRGDYDGASPSDPLARWVQPDLR